jgi:hypothetical protein
MRIWRRATSIRGQEMGLRCREMSTWALAIATSGLAIAAQSLAIATSTEEMTARVREMSASGREIETSTKAIATRRIAIATLDQEIGNLLCRMWVLRATPSSDQILPTNVRKRLPNARKLPADVALITRVETRFTCARRAPTWRLVDSAGTCQRDIPTLTNR